MATITPTIASVTTGIASITWAAQTDADTATAFDNLGFVRGAVQFDGTFGGATIVLQGSNDNSNWATLDDVAGVAISATAAAIIDFLGHCRYIRPLVTAGTAESLNTRVIMRG